MSLMMAATRPRRLEDKTAVIFGAAGEVGSAVAKELAAHGACLFLSGRRKTPLPGTRPGLLQPRPDRGGGGGRRPRRGRGQQPR